jgi:transcriptional regulator with XRE-family HTH domain
MRRQNKLRMWFQLDPQPMSKAAFAEAIGVTASYVSQLCRDTPPWPGRAVARRIAEVTNGYVRPDDWAGYEGACSPGDMPVPSPA